MQGNNQIVIKATMSGAPCSIGYYNLGQFEVRLKTEERLASTVTSPFVLGQKLCLSTFKQLLAKVLYGLRMAILKIT